MSVRRNSTLAMVKVLDVFNNRHATKEKVTEQVSIIQSQYYSKLQSFVPL